MSLIFVFSLLNTIPLYEYILFNYNTLGRIWLISSTLLLQMVFLYNPLYLLVYVFKEESRK